MSGADVKIGDRVHVPSGGCALPMLGTITAIERSAAGTVYMVEVGHGTMRAVQVALVEVSDEPTWRQTAENLREAVALLTEERDRNAAEAAKARVEAAEARKDAQEWGLLASKYERVRAEAQAAQEVYRDARAQLWHAEDERDAARKERDEALQREEALKVSREEVLDQLDLARAQRFEIIKERDEATRALNTVRARVAKLETELTARGESPHTLHVALDAVTRRASHFGCEIEVVRKERDEARAFLRRTAMGGSIVSTATMTPAQVTAAEAADRMFVTPDGYGFVYVSDGAAYEMTCDLERVTVECNALRRTLERVTAERDEARIEAPAGNDGKAGRDALCFLRRTAFGGGSIVSSTTMTPAQIAAARAADRMLVTPDGYGFVIAAKECDEARARAAKLETELAAVLTERDAARKECGEAHAHNYRLRTDLENAAQREATCKLAAYSLTRAGLAGSSLQKSVYWGWVEQLTEGARRAVEVLKERNELEAERDEARKERDEAHARAYRLRAERSASRRERDALDRRCAETIHALEHVTAEREALRRRAAQIAELLRAEGDAEGLGEPP